MIALAALIHLPLWGVAAFGILVIAGHNSLDPLTPAQFGSLSGLWTVLHEGGVIRGPLGLILYVGYPLLPWIGVMAAGFAFGAVMQLERDRRRRTLWWLGGGLTLAFILIRGSNLYGDPHPWTPQTRGAVFTFLSFLNCEKYPPSLLYLLMTLGPSLMALASFDRELGKLSRPIIIFGRVPLFYYLLHIPLIHVLAIVYSYVQYGTAKWLFVAPPFFGLDGLYPQDYGFGLPGVYAVWLLAVALLYPLCRWFAALKQRRRDAWLSYF